MKRIAIIAALLAFPAPAAARSTTGVWLLDHAAAGLSALYGETSTAIADYSAAMLRYRTSDRALDFAGRGYPFVWRGAPVGGTWTWAAADGSALRRTGKGAFLLVLADRPGNIFVEITCLDAGWPQFACSDERIREMSAPDLTTIVFDDIVFSRSLGMQEPPPSAEAAPVASQAPAEPAIDPEPLPPPSGGDQ